MTSLKPCPFCGGEAYIRQVDDGKWHINTLRCGNGDISHHAYVIAGTKAEAIAAWNTRAADKPETYHDDFYDCESTVDASEQDSREKLEADLERLTNKWHDYDGNYMRIYSTVAYAQVKELLDRQAAITKRELCKQCEWPSLAAQPDQEAYDRIAELQAKVDELTDERDEWRARAEQASESYLDAKSSCDELRNQLYGQPCVNGLRETALDYTERLGEAAKTLHIETRCTYDDLRVLCKTLMGVFE